MVSVLHLSTTSEGGAGLAALRLIDAQNRFGLDANFFYRATDRNYIHDNAVPNFISKIDATQNNLCTLTNKVLSRKEFKPMSFIAGSSIDFKLLNKQRFDVLHIHNWYNFLSISDLTLLCKKFPTVMTLHDQRIMTGGCHYSIDCNNYLISCVRCPAMKIGKTIIPNVKKQIDTFLYESNKLVLISPSLWLADLFNGSRKEQAVNSIRVIPNVMDSSLYKSSYSRRLDRDKFNLVFAATNIASKTKGLHLLLGALEKISSFKYPINLHIVGAGEYHIPKISGVSIIRHPILKSHELYELLSRSDLCVVPSISDNSPSIVTEAQMLGTPVLATQTGGIGELIEHGKTGFLSQISVDDISKQLKDILNNSELESIGEQSKKVASERHDPLFVVKQHEIVYRKVIQEHVY